ncbi:MAG: BrxA/BrxB family bacilliredoxin [Gemmatimonadaceae bacterium]
MKALPIYDERLVGPMRQELTRIGFQELRTAEAVDALLQEPGTALIVVNSVCGCSARNARPAVAQALTRGKAPARLATVFAGQDVDATQRAREHFTGYAPSSPSMGLFRDGKLVYMLERWQIEGRSPAEIAQDLVEAFAKYC